MARGPSIEKSSTNARQGNGRVVGVHGSGHKSTSSTGKGYGTGRQGRTLSRGK